MDHFSRPLAPCRVHTMRATHGATHPVTPQSHAGSSPPACISVDCSTYPLQYIIHHGDITYVLRPDGSADPEASSIQAATYVSTIGSLNRNQTFVFGSQKLGFSLPPWLTI
eukprot:8890933-Ditylum_brightwellii.AAC.1